MPTSAVIPNWNGIALLPALVEDLRKQTVPFHEIVMVDNGSTDGSPEWAEREGLRVVRSSENHGFAWAVNRGVEASGTEIAAVFNNDIRLDRVWLERMLSAIGDRQYAVGKVLRASEPDVLDATWDSVCRGGASWRCGFGRPDGPIWSREKDVEFPPFTAILLKRDEFLFLGGLDESFGSYLEDVEFGLRCASKGHSGVYVPGAVCRHLGSATLGYWNARTVRNIARNQILLVARHYPPPLIREFGWQIAVAQVLWGFVALRHGRGGAWLRGKSEGLRSFRSFRGPGSPGIREILLKSEQEIRELQTASGRDWYWRLYFALSG